MVIHTVKSGETLDSIARNYSVPPERIIADNFLTDPSSLAVGQALVILFPRLTYTVRAGDTLSKISEMFRVPIIKLWQNNPLLSGGESLAVGQVLNILYPENKLGSVISAGYTFPETDREIIRRTLPYLSRLYIFTYGLGENGTLLEPDDTELIGLSRQYGATPVMVISPINENGEYNEEIFKDILQSEQKQKELISRITSTAAQKGYGGVNTSFEFLGDIYDDKYEDFLNALRNSLSAEGIFLTAEVPPNISETARDDEDEQIESDGDNEDGAVLTTFEITDKSKGPTPVFPINLVENAVRNAVRNMDSEKILLGLANYGYVWKIPKESSEAAAQSVSNTEAVDLAVDFGADIEFDETAENPFIRFSTNKEAIAPEYELWFEDARTAKASLDLVTDYNLLGFAVWNIRSYFAQFWAILNSMFNVIKE